VDTGIKTLSIFFEHNIKMSDSLPPNAIAMHPGYLLLAPNLKADTVGLQTDNPRTKSRQK